jgi:hypothetical protein
VTMNLVWPVVLRDGYFWYGECAGVCELQTRPVSCWQQGLASVISCFCMTPRVPACFTVQVASSGWCSMA